MTTVSGHQNARNPGNNRRIPALRPDYTKELRANGSLKRIYGTPAPVWQAINRFARTQLALDESSPDAFDFLDDVLELGAVR